MSCIFGVSNKGKDMEMIKKQLEPKTTEELKRLFYDLRESKEEGSAVVFSVLCDVL